MTLMLDDAEGLPSHYCAGLITHLGASLGGKETEVEAGEHLPTPLTFCLPAREKAAGLSQGAGLTEAQHLKSFEGKGG